MAEWIKRATIVDGNTRVGLYAPDGSFNVVEADGSEHVGVYHPCGAYWVTPTTVPHPAYAPDGSMYISQDVWAEAGGV